MRWLAAFLLLSAPAAAAEYAHCYLGEAPADAPLSSGQDISTLLPNLQIATLKNACGLMWEADQTMLTGIVDAGGCSETSEIAAYVRETFDMTSEAARAELGGNVPEDLMDKLCAAASACAPGAEGYDEACVAGVTAAVGQR